MTLYKIVKAKINVRKVCIKINSKVIKIDDSKENSHVEIENEAGEAISEQYESEKDHESDSEKESFGENLNTESRVFED